MLSLLIVSTMLSQAPSLESARADAQAFYKRDVATLMAHAGPLLKKQFPTVETLAAFVDKVRGSFGEEFRVMGETFVTRNGLRIYRRGSGFTYWARGVELELGYDVAGQLSFVNAQSSVNAAPSPHESDIALTNLRLPFEGAWNVLWGGRTWDDNRHAAVCDERFALDLLIYKGNQTFKGDVAKNESYYAWGLPVLAPADGVIVTAENRVPDNIPNQILLGSLYGNHVIIDHGNGEYSLIAHMQSGSVNVKVGQTVTSGQPIGKTGNSGMSTEPHIHYQLMDHADWKKAHGLPLRFEQLMRNGKVMQQAEPLRGDVIAPVPFEARR